MSAYINCCHEATTQPHAIPRLSHKSDTSRTSGCEASRALHHGRAHHTLVSCQRTRWPHIAELLFHDAHEGTRQRFRTVQGVRVIQGICTAKRPDGTSLKWGTTWWSVNKQKTFMRISTDVELQWRNEEWPAMLLWHLRGEGAEQKGEVHWQGQGTRQSQDFP